MLHNLVVRLARGLVLSMVLLLGLASARPAQAVSPPCSLTPLWQFSTGGNQSISSGVTSDLAGNLYVVVEHYPDAAQGEALTSEELVSLDQNGNVRFRRVVAQSSGLFSVARPIVVDSFAVMATLDVLARAVHLVAVRTRDGSVAWTRDVTADLQQIAGGPITDLFFANLGRGEGYLAVPLSYTATLPGGSSGRGALAAYVPTTGALLGILQTAPTGQFAATPSVVLDESGNLYFSEINLTSWAPFGDFRYSIPEATPLAAGSGLLAAAANGFYLNVFRASNGSLIGSQSLPAFFPLISGNRFTFIGCVDSTLPCKPALTTYDIPSSTERWRTPLGDADAFVVDPILTSVGSVVLLQETQVGSTFTGAIREFEAAGNEYITCSIPSTSSSDVYTGLTIVGNRFIVRTGHRLLAFDAYGHRPASTGWVMADGGPQGDRRSR